MAELVSNEIETANERFDESIRRADVGDPPSSNSAPVATSCSRLVRFERRGGLVHEPT